MRIAVPDLISNSYFPAPAAVELGFFKAEGLEMELDLVEISPNAKPPVCKIIDYKKFLYEQKKKQKELKAKQTKVVLKEIRFGPNTDEHDFQFKLKSGKVRLVDLDLICTDDKLDFEQKIKDIAFSNNIYFS